MAEKIPGYIERLLLPKLSTIEAKIDRVESKVDALEKVVDARFESVETQIGELKERLNIVQDLAVLKAQVNELRAKSTS